MPAPDPAPVVLDAAAAAGMAREMLPPGGRMVFTNGCFDILHAGHVHLLREARSMGDILVVGLNSDRSVRELKGPGRPVNPFVRRAECLSAVRWVDLVAGFDEPTPMNLIEIMRPDVLVKGGDYSEREIVGAGFVIASGGAVRTVPLIPGLSTTALLEDRTTGGR